MVNGKELVLVELTDGNTAKHPINYQGTRYGQRKHGERFYIQADHLPYLFVKRVVADEPEAAAVVVVEPEPDTPLEPPTLEAPAIVEPGAEEEGINALFQWNDEQLEQLGALNVNDVADVLRIGVDGLMTVKGIGRARATFIVEKAKGFVNAGG